MCDLPRMRNRLFYILLFSATLIGFQNCAPPAQQGITDPATSSGSGSNTQASSSGSSTSGVSGFGSNTVNNPGSSGGSSGGSNVGGFNTGGSSGGSSGSSGGSTGGTTTGSLRILKQPVGVTVHLNESFSLTVDVAGGTAPYKYQWYKNSAAMTNGLGTFYFLSDMADRYSKEGNYYLKITDSAGASLTSATVRVGILEGQGPCDAAQYMMFNAPNRDPSGNNTIEFFDNSHGKYLVNKSDQAISWLNMDPGYFDVSYFNFTPALQDGQRANVSCATQIDRIHNRQPNPEYADTYYGNQQYSNTYYWQYQGAVTFECHAQKYKFVSDTCKWVQVHAYPSDSGGGGGGR